MRIFVRPGASLLVLFLFLFTSACTRETVTLVPSAPTPLPPQPAPNLALADLVGLWLVEDGALMSDFVAGLATFGETADVTAIRIGDDGTGDVWIRDRQTGTLDCVRAYVIFDDDDGTLAFDFAREKTTDVVFNTALDRYAYVFPIVSVDNGFLGLADENGSIAIFSSQTVLPPDVICQPLQVLATYDVPAPQFFSDVVLYNGDLIFNSGSAGQIERFDLATLGMIAPLGPTSSRLVQTAEGGTFWSHCGCGGSRDAFQRNISSLFDTVSSEDEMGGPITFRAMAYVPTTDRLWIHGRKFSDSFGRFFVMNTNGEPDVVEQEISFNRDLRGLAFDGTDLWGIVTVASQSVVRIDPGTGSVVESFEVPDPDVSWAGIEWVGGSMYMLGTDLDGDGVLMQVSTQIPASVAR